MTFRDRIQPQLRDWYDASAGFDFEHLEEFVPKCNAAELANLREDPQVKAWDQMIPGPDGAPQVKIRVYAPSQREKAPLPCSSTTAEAFSSARSTGRRTCASGM